MHKSNLRLDQKLYQFLLFHCDAIFDKLSKLGQMSCVILLYTEIKNFFHLRKFFVIPFENWYKIRKIIA